MYLLPLYFCLISFLFSVLFSKYIGITGNYIFTTLNLFYGNIISFFIFYEVCINNTYCLCDITYWIHTVDMTIEWKFLFDSLSAIMLLVVTSISFFAHLYSISYMHGDPHQPRFMSYLSFFTFFMLLLISSNNLLLLFVGWEGIGICSFLLINFWYTRLQANKAALKAMFLNKIGDLTLLTGIVMLLYIYGSLNYFLLHNVMYYVQYTFAFNTNHYIVGIMLVIAAVGKSAQIGLHLWLPDAMEGPTPVSSLIHAATLVTAGIFLLLRISFLLEYTPSVLIIILFLSSLTIFFAGTTGLFQNDIKKIIAYSTCSQIGYMFFILSFSGYQMSIFHLFTHAFFKALLFLTAGAIIHSIANEQDIRKMGGLLKTLPFAYVCFSIGSFTLMGFPFLTGFYSKDSLLEYALFSFNINTFSFFDLSALINACYWLIIQTVLFTAFYSIKILSYTFLNFFNGLKNVLVQTHEMSYILAIPLFCLSIYSIFVGFFFKDIFIGVGSPIWKQSIFTLYSSDYEFNSFFSKQIPFVITLWTTVFAFLFYNVSFFFYKIICIYFYSFIQKIVLFFNKKWFFDKIYNNYINVFSYILSNFFFKEIEKGFLELCGTMGLVVVTQQLSANINKIRTNLLYHYSGLVLNVLFILLILFFFFF